MLPWIRRWAERRRQRQRAIFPYHDGTRPRRADPAAIWRGLLSHPTMDLERHVPLAEQGQEPERQIVLDAICQIFAVEQWSEETAAGLTAWELLDLLRQFDEYLAALKKNTSPSRMPWQLWAYGYSSGQASPAPATSASAASSSTPDDLSFAADTISCEPSPTE